MGKQGFTALEMVFMIFILVVVTLVVIRMFTQYMNPKQVTNVVNDVTKHYKYTQLRQICEGYCEEFKNAADSDTRLYYAYLWCTEKLRESNREGIDFNGDGEYNGPVVIANKPYCEDGLYCFHFFSCQGDYMTLDMKACPRIICQYLSKTMPADQVTKAINNMQVISTGTCQKDIHAWPKEMAEKVLDYFKWGNNDDGGPDWWFNKTIILTTGSDVYTFKNITCSAY